MTARRLAAASLPCLLLATLLSLSRNSVAKAFVVVTPTTTTTKTKPTRTTTAWRTTFDRPPRLLPTKSPVSSSRTALFLYNPPPPPLLPPPPPPQQDLRDVAVGAATLLGFGALCWFTPLGSLLWLALNSFVALTLLLPILVWLGATVWTAFNTMQAPCPTCGAPVRVLKRQAVGIQEEDEAIPNVCVNCGTWVVQSAVNTNALEVLLTAPENPTGNMNNPNIWDAWFGNGAGNSWTTTTTTTTIVEEEETPEKAADRYRRERTIIDVDADASPSNNNNRKGW